MGAFFEIAWGGSSSIKFDDKKKKLKKIHWIECLKSAVSKTQSKGDIGIPLSLGVWEMGDW